MRVLVTGFGPFRNVVDNPSGRLADRIAREPAGYERVASLVLPVSFARADAAVRELLSRGRFDVALLLGVATGETGLRIERCARARDSARAVDVDGARPVGEPGPRSLPEVLDTPVDTVGLMDALHAAGVPARLSEDAGGYVCNRVYYAALETIALAGLRTAALFVHVPADEHTFERLPTGPAMPFGEQLAAVRHVLAWLTAGPRGA